MFHDFTFVLPARQSFTSAGPTSNPAKQNSALLAPMSGILSRRRNPPLAALNREEKIYETAPHVYRPGPGCFDVDDRVLLPPMVLPATLLHILLLSTARSLFGLRRAIGQ